METVLIIGGSGTTGKWLSRKLVENGYNVGILSRTVNMDTNVKYYYWDPFKNEIETEAISTADYIIHLVGANIGEKRWTSKRRKELYESRIKTGELIFNNADKNLLSAGDRVPIISPETIFTKALCYRLFKIFGNRTFMIQAGLY